MNAVDKDVAVRCLRLQELQILVTMLIARQKLMVLRRRRNVGAPALLNRRIKKSGECCALRVALLLLRNNGSAAAGLKFAQWWCSGFCQARALPRVTEWEQFRALNFLWLKKVMAKPVLVDLRNVPGGEPSRVRVSGDRV